MEHHTHEETKSILVIDDDQTVREVIVDALNLEGSYRTSEVDSGFSALDILNKRTYDLIISDHRMPGMSGLDLLHKIKEKDPSVPIIMMTGYPSIDLSVSAIKEGAVDFIAKPFKIDDLLFKVNLYLKEKTFHHDACKDNSFPSHNLDKKIRTLSAISCFDEIIDGSEGNNEDVFQELVALTIRITGADYCFLTLFDEHQNSFHLKIAKMNTHNGESGSTVNDLHESLDPLFREVILSKKPVLIPTSPPSVRYESLMCLPLMIRDKVFGILTLLHMTQQNVFNQNDLTYVRTIVKRSSLNIENTLLYESLFMSIMDTFKSLVHSIHVRDQYTERHSMSVKNFAVRIAEALRCPDQTVESIRVAAALHDIGKIAIPDNILLKPGKLTFEEYEIIKEHPVIGESILKSISLLDYERIIILHHHERWDGKGYPDGLKGTDIPFPSRILAVADTFDAMTSDRPYRKGLSVHDAVSELKRNSNLQFDRTIVEAFLSTL